MDKTKALQNLLKGKATRKEIELLKQALASGEISIGGDVNRSVVIIGSGNKVELTSEALSLLIPETTKEEIVEGEPPYMGLRYFDTQDADLFYGREALTRELLARVQKESFLAIVGSSGSGKSSVARAGLIPSWQKENAERGAIHVITPTAHPLESLAASLTRESESVTATSTLMDDMNRDARSLRLYVRRSVHPNPLLLVDQFEETFTLCKDPAERTAFIANLLALAEDDAARVVITLRADFYHHCAEYEGLRNALKSHQEYIGAMTADELRQAITTPAENNGWNFQPGLVDLILQDVGTEPGALPLLSHALLETWKRRQGRTLTLQGYADAGGVKKAIAQTAESVYDKLTPAEQTIARGIFLRLTELGEGVQDTRRRVKLDELAQTTNHDAVEKVLKTLADARLVTTEQDSAEVAHEALIREWGTLRKWLDEDRDSLRLHRHLTESAVEWERRGKEASELYRGARLKGIQEWMKERSDQLSPLEREFLKASRNVKKQEFLRWVTAASVGALLLLTIALAVSGKLNRFIYQPVDMKNYWVTIPAGEFQMGSSDKQIEDALKMCPTCDFSDEQPQHLVYLDAYQIGKYEVTNIQYFQCVKSSVCVGSAFGTGMDFHPVISITWYDAQTYCKWVGGRLPTEAEWEKAASWDDEMKRKLVYPWGNNIDCTHANYGDCGGNTTEVGNYQSGKSPYGIYDMAGNIWEWTSSLHYDYPYDAMDGREDLNNPYFRVLRGGYWRFGDYNVRSAVRGHASPTEDPRLRWFSLCAFATIAIIYLQSQIMDKNQSLQNLLNNTATEEDIELLKRLLASGEISIGGNVNQSVIIIGSGNTVELPLAALDRLGARPMLGNLDRDLTGEEIAAGLRRLDKLLPNRAPVLLPHYKEQVGRLRPILKTEIKSLSETARRERIAALAAINSICVEALDISFNGVALGEEAPKYDARSPFRGLESFRPEDSEFFFGREALTKKLVGKINAHSFLAVLGASGSGKSSLVMAGLIPMLGSEYVIFRPGTDPLGALESAKEKALIVVDQFEELFTLTRDVATRKEFISKLLEARQKIVITLRSDFLGEVGAYRALSEEIQSHLEIVPPMNMDELRRAMEGQAGVVGLRFEADLSQQILDDVEGEPGAMPLLQHALWELWNRRHGRWLRASEYRAFGGVKQAITSTAEKVYGECTKAEQEQMRDIFLRLTRLDDSDEGRDTRRRVAMSDLIPSGRDTASITLLLEKLANARLIVKTFNADKTEIEVAHEALIRHWARLRAWLHEDRNNLRLREGVSEDAKEWESAGKDESLLTHRGGRLDDALSLGNNSRYRLTTIERVYLGACVALRNKEQREREQRLRWTVIVSIAAAIIFLLLGGSGLIVSIEATNQTKIALARQLSAQAQSIFSRKDSGQQIAVLLAIQSMRMFPTFDAAQILQNNTLADQITRMVHYGSVYSVAFSPDGKRVVSGDEYGYVIVWDATSGEEIARMKHTNYPNEDGVYSVAFSPDGLYVASGSLDSTARVWEAASGKEISRMTHDGGVIFVAFSPDGRRVVSGSGDNTVRVWDVTSGAEIARMTHSSSVTSAAFSPDGERVVSGYLDGTVIVWDADSGKEIARMTHDDLVASVAFSPDGKYVVSGSKDNTARVWDATSGEEIAHTTHDDAITSAAFSPDGKWVVSGSDDGVAIVWDAASGEEIARMTHDEDESVNAVAFSPDGKRVVSGSDDHTVRVWDADNGKEIARITSADFVNSVAFSPDGRWVVSGSDDNTVRIWDADSREESTRMIHDDALTSIAFSSDRQRMVSGNSDNTVRVWDITRGKEIARMAHDDTVNSVAFSPDGKWVVSGSEDNTARVWDAASGEEIARMTHEGPVNSVAFSPDGQWVVSGSRDGAAIVWDVTSGEEIARMIHTGSVNPVAYVAFSLDGKRVVSGDWFDAVIWDATSGEEIARMEYDEFVVAPAFSPDGERVVSGYLDGTVIVWDANSGKEIARMTHDDWVTSVAFSPDGKYVVSGSKDNTARVWDAASGQEIARWIHDGDVSSVAFSPRYVVSGSADGTVHVWLYRPDDLIAEACSRVTRNLTRDEWQQYIGDALPYQAVCPNLPD